MNDDGVSFADLEQARAIAAELVLTLGEAYLPHFERLDREYQERMRIGSTLERARMLALQKRGLTPIAANDAPRLPAAA